MRVVFCILVLLVVVSELFLARHSDIQSKLHVMEASLDNKVTFLVITGSLLGVFKLKKNA